MREELSHRLNFLKKKTIVTWQAELLESLYFTHGQDVQGKAKEYAQLATSLQSGKHLTFVKYQNDILDGVIDPPNQEVDPSIEDALYKHFMRYLQEVILTWYYMYETDPTDTSDSNETTNQRVT